MVIEVVRMETEYRSPVVAKLVESAEKNRETDPSHARGLYVAAVTAAAGNGDADKVPYLQKKIRELDRGPVVVDASYRKG